MRRGLDDLRVQLSHPDMLFGLSVLGLATGVVAGAVIVTFRFLVEFTQEGMLPGEGAENYEALPMAARFLLPLFTGLLLAAMFRWFARGQNALGIARVMERMGYHQGHFSGREFWMQFFGAAIAIIGGHSVGREGPHVFLGAAAGSILGQQVKLPNNTIRTLVACGTAAGIGASFNTPLAGVIFALEVVMMEYTVTSFIPVMLASVSATVLSNSVFGTAPAFAMPVLEVHGLTMMQVVLVLGLFVGVMSAGLNHALEKMAAHTRAIPIWWRMTAAGIGLGLFGMAVPAVMGIGYDTVQLALDGELALRVILLLLVTKLLAASISLGLGVPGGVIGPSLFIGAMSGALVANLVLAVAPQTQIPIGAFALLGMGAAMSASLQAPLAGLTAMFELTDNPEIILPGMLAVVISGLTARELLGKDSLFVTQLRAAGMDYRTTPVLQALRRHGVASVMNRSFAGTPRHVSRDAAHKTLSTGPEWLLLAEDDTSVDGSRVMIPAADLARRIAVDEDGGAGEDAAAAQPEIDLLEIPGDRRMAVAIALQATLQEAVERLDERGAEALYVEGTPAAGRRIYGVLTRKMIERTYMV